MVYKAEIKWFIPMCCSRANTFFKIHILFILKWQCHVFAFDTWFIHAFLHTRFHPMYIPFVRHVFSCHQLCVSRYLTICWSRQLNVVQFITNKNGTMIENLFKLWIRFKWNLFLLHYSGIINHFYHVHHK